MATDKKSFLIYCDLIHTVEKLPDDKAGELFKHILRYVNDMNPSPTDMMIDLVFEPIKQALKRDLEKYETRRERNSANGSKGGRPKNQDKPKKPTGFNGLPEKATGLQENPIKAKKADSVNVNDNVIDKDKVIEIDKESKIRDLDKFNQKDYKVLKKLKNELCIDVLLENLHFENYIITRQELKHEIDIYISGRISSGDAEKKYYEYADHLKNIVKKKFNRGDGEKKEKDKFYEFSQKKYLQSVLDDLKHYDTRLDLDSIKAEAKIFVNMLRRSGEDVKPIKDCHNQFMYKMKKEYCRQSNTVKQTTTSNQNRIQHDTDF